MIHGKTPIKVELVKKDIYKIILKLDNWEVSAQVNEKALTELKQQIDVVLQRRINKDGSYYDYPQNIDFR